MKHIHFIYTLLFGVAAFLFFGIAYPHHLHYQEQFQLFLFDKAYVWDIIKLPGGVADLLGRFCTQFFLFAWVGAFIIALLLTSVQLLTLRLVRWERLYALSFVPACLLWLFILDENALIGGIWAVLITLLASWAFDNLSGNWTRRIVLIAAIPLLYWMAGPISLLFFLLQALRPKLSAWYYCVFVILAIMIVALQYFLPVPASKLWLGIHYHRYPTEVPTTLWAAAMSVFVLVLLVRITQRWASAQSHHSKIAQSHYSRYLSAGITFMIVAIGMGCLIWNKANFKAEKTMRYDFMACHQQWNRIIETINAEKPNNQIGVTVQNLALAMHGMLLQHISEYNQNGMLGLLPDIGRDATSPMPTAEAFYQLGMTNFAQCAVFEAQEAILDFQKSARCYKRLAQTNLINGNYEVARKYLTALQKTLFYRDWANETMSLLHNEKAIDNHPEYGRLRKMTYKEDFYFSDHVTPQMLESLYNSNTGNNLAYQYMMAAFMLTNDRESFFRYATTQNYSYNSSN